MDISVVNSWIIYKTNFPSLIITTQKLLRERLVEELIQPLLTLQADVTCPKHLQHSGKKIVSNDTRLIGKHYSYKSPFRKNCVF